MTRSDLVVQLAERFGQLTVARLELVKKPHVFDRDYCLRREGLQ